MVESILVAGGAGFIGSHVAEWYAERGKDVTVLDNMSRVELLEKADETRDTPKHNVEYLKSNYPEIRIENYSIQNEEMVFEIVEGHDTIVHTAAQVSLTTSAEDPIEDFEINARGTLNLLEAASQVESDPTFVFASSNQIYGQNVNDIPIAEGQKSYSFEPDEYSSGIDESFSVDQTQHGPYGVSKLAADQYVQDYVARGELDGAVFRMGAIYGPRQFGNENQGWVSHFALSALQDKPVKIYGDGKQVRDVLYVKDVVRAYHSFIEDPTTESVVFNLGGGPENSTSLLEFIDLLEAEFDLELDHSFEDWWDGDQRVWITDTTRAQEELNWNPKISFNEGVERFLKWADGI
jgi:CDP-paratose 2-epimerase